jgi:hypothetical protein
MGLQTRRFNTGAGIALATAIGLVLWAGVAAGIFLAVSN